jgi:hypothetical protein
VPGIEAVTAVANAVAEVAETVRPFLLEWQAQKYENERKERVLKVGDAFASGDPGRMRNAVIELLHDAGQPVGSESIHDVRLNAAYLEALADLAAKYICLDKQLQSLLAALKRKA